MNPLGTSRAVITFDNTYAPPATGAASAVVNNDASASASTVITIIITMSVPRPLVL